MGAEFKASRFEIELISKIADRAVELAKAHGIDYDKCTALMDLDATISNGAPIKLDKLLEADDFNFAHDIFGIRTHLNRQTGKLEDAFLPRYSL